MQLIPIPTGLPIGDVNVLLIDAPGGPVLVDTGPDIPQAKEALEEGVKAAGVSLGEISQLWLTHAHVDHVGLAKWVHETSGAPVFGSRETARWLSSWHEMWDRRIQGIGGFLKAAGAPDLVTGLARRAFSRFRAMGAPLAGIHILEEGDRWEGAQVLRVDGHAKGHLAFDFPEKEMIILGDHLLDRISSNAILEPPEEGESLWPSMLSVHLDNLAKVAALGSRTGLGGHGKPIKDVAATAHRRLKEAGERNDKVTEILATPRTFWEVAESLFPHLKPQEGFLAVSEVAGHIFRLRDRGTVAIEPQGDVWSIRRRDLV